MTTDWLGSRFAANLNDMSGERTREVFDTTAASYDPARARLIPGFDRFYGTALELIPAGAKHILDLGAGTGLFSAMVRARFPHASLRLVDNSEPMLAQARERFSGDDQVVFQLGDYSSADWGGGFDAIVSALSIHHLEDAAKRALFRRIHEGLRPGGVFVNAEQILAPTPELEAQAKAAWLNEVRALGATEEQVRASLLRQTEDRCSTVEDQLRWLREAGFTETGCAYQQGRFAVLQARRAS